MNRARHNLLTELRQSPRQRNRRPMFVSWLVCFGAAASAAAMPTNAITPYKVRCWQTDDGLPQNSVHAIAQTRDGYLWVGTREGLARFDGVRFTPPDERAPQELQHGWITALFAIRDGSLWIGCEGFGLARWKEGTFTRFSEADGLVSNQIRCLLAGRDGALWIGSEGGLTRYKDGKFSNFTEKNGLLASSVRGLCEDQQGNLRIATARGLSTLNKEGTIRTLEIRPRTAANSLKFVCEDRQGSIWTGSNEGLNRVERETITTYGPEEGLPNKMVMTGYEDRRGQLWVGTYHGIARMAQGRFVPWPDREGVFGDLIYTLFEDREGNLWVGAQDGLYRLTPARFMAYTTQEGLTRNNVMSVCEDSSGATCIGTWGGGLNRLKNERISPGGVTQPLKDGEVLALHEGRDGSLWVGMDHGGGLIRVNGASETLFARSPQLFEAAIRVIHEDRAGALWIGTSRGLNHFKDGKFTGYTTADGLAGNMVFALCEEPDGGMWIGTDGGLSQWNGGNFSRLTMPEGASTNWVNALYLDRDQTLWVGTRGSGLYRMKGGKFIAYTARQGLFSDEVYEILEDDSGYFWMSCRKGIFRVGRKQLEEFAQGIRKTISCTAFGRADGLPSVQCNGVAKPAGWKSRDGRLWFPTIRGVVAVQAGLETNDRPPPVVIEEVIAGAQLLRSGGLPASDSSSVRVPPGRGRIEIHYTALSFKAPEKNRFRYRLEGIDPAWVDAGPHHSASYDNIAPGRYRFQVVACNNDGVWNEDGAALML
jgi:ligand-binding sensor domain-containing protein